MMTRVMRLSLIDIISSLSCPDQGQRRFKHIETLQKQEVALAHGSIAADSIVTNPPLVSVLLIGATINFWKQILVSTNRGVGTCPTKNTIRCAEFDCHVEPAMYTRSMASPCYDLFLSGPVRDDQMSGSSVQYFQRTCNEHLVFFSKKSGLSSICSA
jgi:hypothetical protein